MQAPTLSGVGNDLRAYEQQLLNNLFQQQMGVQRNYFANLVGDPTILNKSQSQGSTKSSFNLVGMGRLKRQIDLKPAVF